MRELEALKSELEMRIERSQLRFMNLGRITAPPLPFLLHLRKMDKNKSIRFT